MEEKEIIKQMEEKRKLPKEVKNKIISAFGDCTLSAIIVYVYFIFLNLGIKNIHQNIYLTDLKVFSVSLAVIAVVFFENAYNKKSTKKIYIGIEILVLAIITLLLEYVVLYLTPKYRIIIPIFAILYNIYFVFKALLTMHKIKSDYKKSQSDIKEIVKEKRKK